MRGKFPEIMLKEDLVEEDVEVVILRMVMEEEEEVTPEEEAPTESHPTTLWLEAVDPSMQEPTKSTYRELTPDMGW